MFALAASLHAFVPPSARATPRKSIACVEQRPTSSGDHIVSRRSLADAAVGLAALGLLGQPGASSAYEPPRGPAAFEARKAYYEAEREKRVLSTPTVMRMWKKLKARWFRPSSAARRADWSNVAARSLGRPDRRLPEARHRAESAPVWRGAASLGLSLGHAVGLPVESRFCPITPTVSYYQAMSPNLLMAPSPLQPSRLTRRRSCRARPS